MTTKTTQKTTIPPRTKDQEALTALQLDLGGIQRDLINQASAFQSSVQPLAMAGVGMERAPPTQQRNPEFDRLTARLASMQGGQGPSVPPGPSDATSAANLLAPGADLGLSNDIRPLSRRLREPEISGSANWLPEQQTGGQIWNTPFGQVDRGLLQRQMALGLGGGEGPEGDIGGMAPQDATLEQFMAGLALGALAIAGPVGPNFLNSYQTAFNDRYGFIPGAKHPGKRGLFSEEFDFGGMDSDTSGGHGHGTPEGAGAESMGA